MPRDQTIEIIAALAANRVIGRNGQLPWHLPDDLKWFKTITTGRPVVMGRRTFESVGKPLPNRHNIVVSRTWHAAPPGVTLAPSLDAALQLAGPGRICIVGGGELYRAALPLAHVLHLTELDAAYDGDATFPDFDRSEWRLTRDQRHDPDAKHATGFHIRTYDRVAHP